QARAGVEAGVRVQVWTAGGILAAQQTRRVAGGAGLPEDGPERSRDALPCPVSEHAESGREARELSRGSPMVRQLPQVLPDGCRLGGDQLPTRGPSLREQGFRRGGQTV